MKFGYRLSNLFRIKCTKFYSDSFRLNTCIVQCPGGLLSYGHSVDIKHYDKVSDLMMQKVRLDHFIHIYTYTVCCYIASQ